MADHIRDRAYASTGLGGSPTSGAKFNLSDSPLLGGQSGAGGAQGGTAAQGGPLSRGAAALQPGYDQAEGSYARGTGYHQGGDDFGSGANRNMQPGIDQSLGTHVASGRNATPADQAGFGRVAGSGQPGIDQGLRPHVPGGQYVAPGTDEGFGRVTDSDRTGTAAPGLNTAHALADRGIAADAAEAGAHVTGHIEIPDYPAEHPAIPQHSNVARQQGTQASRANNLPSQEQMDETTGGRPQGQSDLSREGWVKPALAPLTGENTAQGAQQYAQAAQEKLAGAAETVRSYLPGNTEDVKQGAQQTADRATEAGQQGADSARNTAAGAQQRAGEYAESARNTAGEYADSARNTAAGVQQRAGEYAGAAQQTASQYATAAQNTAAGAAQTVREKVPQYTEATKQAVGDYTQAAKQKLNEYAPVVQEKLQTVTGQAQAQAQETYHTAKAQLQDVAGRAEHKVEDFIHEVQNTSREDVNHNILARGLGAVFLLYLCTGLPMRWLVPIATVLSVIGGLVWYTRYRAQSRAIVPVKGQGVRTTGGVRNTGGSANTGTSYGSGTSANTGTSYGTGTSGGSGISSQNIAGGRVAGDSYATHPNERAAPAQATTVRIGTPSMSANQDNSPTAIAARAAAAAAAAAVEQAMGASGQATATATTRRY